MSEDDYRARSKKNLMLNLLGGTGSTFSTLGGLTVGVTIVYEIHLRTQRKNRT